MTNRLCIALCGLVCAAAVECTAQDTTSHHTWFPVGVGIQAGVGYFAVRDDHISMEKYAGSSSTWAFQWSKVHETYGFRVSMSYQKADHIRNHKVSADATMGGFNLVNLYPLGLVALLGLDVSTFLGPSAEAFLYYYRQNIARNTDASPDVYESTAYLLSLGIRGEMVAALSGALQAECAVQVSVVSLGGGSGEASGDNSGMTLLSPFSGLHATAEAALICYPLDNLSFAAGYRLDVARISSWNYILASSDNLFVSGVFHF